MNNTKEGTNCWFRPLFQATFILQNNNNETMKLFSFVDGKQEATLK